jgi:hypothetical protein
MTRLIFIIENSPQRTSLMGIKLSHSILSAAQPKGPLVAIQNMAPRATVVLEKLEEAHRILKANFLEILEMKDKNMALGFFPEFTDQ